MGQRLLGAPKPLKQFTKADRSSHEMKCACVILLLHYSTLTTADWFVVVGPDRPVDGVVGGDALLPCLLKPSISAVDMEVMWLVGSAVVHRYRKHRDEADLQLPAYSNRTSLSREELHRGNVSLRITPVQFSDANTYRCYIVASEEVFETNIELRVEAVGSTPNISIESLGDGSVNLRCQSTGWAPEPWVEWQDSRGEILPAKPTLVRKDSEGFTVQRNVTVLESEGSHFLCRVSNTIKTKVKEADIPRVLFARPRHRLYPCSFLLFFLVSAAVFLVPIGKRLLQGQGLKQYKEWVKTSAQNSLGLSPFPGEPHDHYTDPLIVPLHLDQDKVSTAGEYKIYKLDTLFRRADGGPPPNAVILQGHSGCGKAVTAQKIMCDWASGALYSKQFALVLLLNCTKLRQELDYSAEPKSLVELISPLEKFRHVIEGVLKKTPHKVLFIINGFDELRLSAAVPHSHLPSQPFTRAPPTATIQALLGGRILPESFLLVTTRHTASKTLGKMLRKREQRFTEILGFSKKTVKNYFQKFFDQETAEQEYQYVLENDFLYSSCSIPILCWMVCSILKDLRENGGGLNILPKLETNTSIFLLFCSCHLNDRTQGQVTSATSNALLKSLGQLAEGAAFTGEVLFDEKTVYDTIKNPSVIPVLRKYSLGSDIQQVMYGFVHQTFQEFLTALYCVTLKEAELQTEVKRLLDSVKGPFSHQSIHLRPVIHFLFGLANTNLRSSFSFLNKFYPHSRMSITNDKSPLQNLLEKWILEEVVKFISKDMKLFFLHCLYELHEDEFVKEAMEKWNKIELASLALKWTDFWALRYCLQCRPEIARLNLSNCNLTAESLKLLTPALADLNCEELWLDVEELSDADVGVLISALGTGRTLRRLRVDSPLSHESVQQILAALRDQKSVGSVCLSEKTVSLHTAEMLLSHLHNATVTTTRSVTLTQKLPCDGDGNEDCLCSSLHVRKDQHSFTVSVGHDSITVQPALSELSVTLPSCGNMDHWTNLLQISQQLRQIKNKPELEKDVENLLSYLHSMSDLKKVQLKASVTSMKWASQVFSLIHKCANLQEMDVMVRHQLHEDTVCSFLSVRKPKQSTPGEEAVISITMGQHAIETSSQTPQAVVDHDNRLNPLSLLSLTFPDSDVPSGGWEDFLERFDSLNRIRNANVEKEAKALFSTLHALPGLREVELRLGGLTRSWVQHVLSFIQEQPRDKEITVHVLKEWESCEESLCTSLNVRKTTNSFRLAAEHLSQEGSTPALSYISVLADSQTDAQLDWINYLKRFHTLKHEIKSAYEHENVAPLLFLLRSLSALREVEMRVRCLTDSWAQLIISLTENFPSLQEVRLSAGHAVLSEGVSSWTECGTLLVEDITHLKETPKHTDCTITLTGIKRRATDVACHYREGRLQCNRPVRITMRGETYTEEPLDQ